MFRPEATRSAPRRVCLRATSTHKMRLARCRRAIASQFALASSRRRTGRRSRYRMRQRSTLPRPSHLRAAASGSLRSSRSLLRSRWVPFVPRGCAPRQRCARPGRPRRRNRRADVHNQRRRRQRVRQQARRNQGQRDPAVDGGDRAAVPPFQSYSSRPGGLRSSAPVRSGCRGISAACRCPTATHHS